MNGVPMKLARIFIKDTSAKSTNEIQKGIPDTSKTKENTIKKWEPKKRVRLQEVEVIKPVITNEGSKSKNNKEKESSVVQIPIPTSNIVKPTNYDLVDMISILS